LYRVLIRKIGFHALDTKRFILSGGIHTLAFGNYKIGRIVQQSEDVDMDEKFNNPVKLEELMFDEPMQ